MLDALVACLAMSQCLRDNQGQMQGWSGAPGSPSDPEAGECCLSVGAMKTTFWSMFGGSCVSWVTSKQSHLSEPVPFLVETLCHRISRARSQNQVVQTQRRGRGGHTLKSQLPGWDVFFLPSRFYFCRLSPFEILTLCVHPAQYLCSLQHPGSLRATRGCGWPWYSSSLEREMTLPLGSCCPLWTVKNIFFLNSFYPSYWNTLTLACLIFWVLGLHLNQDFWLAYWVQHFNCFPFLLFDGFFLFNDFQGLPWHPDYVSAGPEINDASSFTAWEENI